MKAWTVRDKWDDDKGAILTWADTATGAKNAGYELEPDCWIDLRVKREPWADDLEDLDEEEMLILQLEQGWQYWDVPVYPDTPEGKYPDNQVWVNLYEEDAEGIRKFGLAEYLIQKVEHDHKYYHENQWQDF